jgi:hemoglobin/transferrin/lactoferrin receptor protein
MKKNILHRSCLVPLILMLMLPAVASAQAQGSGRIEGSVRDARTGAPLISANLFLRTTGRGTFSDREGAFRIPDLPVLEDVLVVSYMGYATREIPVRLAASEVRQLRIELESVTLEMRNVTVTAGRRPEAEFRSQKAVSVAGEEAITARPAGSTGDALRESPGVLVQKTTAGHGAPIIRGLIGQSVLLLYNGVRLNKPTFRLGGNQYLETIDAESLRRIEVVRGPGSVLYGSDALGGVVNLITAPPAFTEAGTLLRPRTHLRYTSADQGRSAHLGFEFSSPRFAAQAGVTGRKVGNLNPGGVIPVHDPTGYSELSGHLISAYRISDAQTLRLDLVKVTQDKVPRFDQYITGEYELYLYDPQDRFLGMVEYTHQQPTPWLNRLEWNISVQREHEGRPQRTTGSTTLRVDDDLINSIGTFLQATSIVAERHTLRWGLEFYYDRVFAGRVDIKPDTSIAKRGSYPDDSRFRQTGLFMSDDVLLGPATDLSVGLRWSDIWYRAPLEDPWGTFEDRFGALTGNLGISHRLRPWLNLVASASTGFRAPNFNDTVVLKTSNNGVDAPSPGLLAETTTNYELGAKIEWDGSDLETFLFYTALGDIIDRRAGTYLGESWIDLNENGLEDPGEQINVKANIGKGYITGVEVQGRFRLGEAWSLRGNAFYTYGQATTADEPMSRIPPLMGLLGLQWRREATTAEVFVRAGGFQHRLSARDVDDTRIDAGGTPGWSDWNLRAGRDLGGVRVDVTFGNIFDHAYKEHGSGVYNPGRNLVLSLSWTGGGR